MYGLPENSKSALTAPSQEAARTNVVLDWKQLREVE